MSAPSAIPPLLTVEELSNQIRLSRDRIWQLARQGDIPVVRLGRAIRFEPSQIERWLQEGGTGGPAGR